MLFVCAGLPDGVPLVPNNRGRHTHHVQVPALKCCPHATPHIVKVTLHVCGHATEDVLFLVRFVELRTWGWRHYWESFKWVRTWKIKTRKQSRRESSAVKRTQCSCRGPSFGFHHPCEQLTATSNSSSREPKSPGHHGHQSSCAHFHTEKHIYTHNYNLRLRNQTTICTILKLSQRSLAPSLMSS